MSALGQARILPRVASDEGAAPAAPILTPERHRRIVGAEMDARDAATTLLEDARRQAEAIVAKAHAAAEHAAETAAEEARAAEHAKVAALYLALRREEEQRADKDLARVVELAIVLSERILGEALTEDPRRIVALAERALAEARGVRKALLEACPLDADLLQHHLDGAGFASHTVEIRPDPSLPRGSLRISTHLGTLDAQLRPQLERLAASLRDALERPSAKR